MQIGDRSMSLLGPNEHDKEKLHSEVNQLVNQRLLITTLAVTVLGAATAWLIPRQTPISPEPIGTFTYLASLLLTIVLFALFLLNHHLTGMLRLFTTYLDETGVSNWEKDWKQYRNKFSYWGYTKPQTVVFLLLGAISLAFPFLLVIACRFTYEPIGGAVACAVAGTVYMILVAGMGLKGWFAREDDIRRRWRKLKGEGRE